MKTNRIRKAEAVYSELAIEMESNTVVCIWAGTERQADRGKAFSGKKRSLRCAPLEAAGKWKLQAGEVE